jgi:class 3 adenylate cyclase
MGEMRHNGNTRAVLAYEAFSLLAKEMNLLEAEVRSEVGPFADGAGILAALFANMCKRVQTIVTVAQYLKTSSQPEDQTDNDLRTITALLGQITRNVVQPLGAAAKLSEKQAQGIIVDVRIRVGDLQEVVRRHLDDDDDSPEGNGPEGGSGGGGSGHGAGGGGRRKDSGEPVFKVIVELDLAHYSEIASFLEGALGPKAVGELNKIIHELIAKSVKAIGLSAEETVVLGTGDGAFLAFDSAGHAHKFAEELHRAAEWRNARQDPRSHFLFRIGISAGSILFRRNLASNGELKGFTMAGTVLAQAVRLESACTTGEVVLTGEAWAKLPDEATRNQYTPTTVQGKREERFWAYRRKIVEPASWDK